MVTKIKPKDLTWWSSPAKLNLFLHINSQYENGYHQLQSLFQLLDYGDELAFEVNETGLITLADPISGVPDADNLIIKAAKLLQQEINSSSPKKLGCTIHLKKNLPMGGGIGGGSSNAATTLVVLNKLWNCQLNEQALAKLGLSLGADVPIFIYGKTAFAEGVGEKLIPTTLADACYLVVFPNCHVSTAEIFTHPDLPRNTAKIDFSEYQFANTRNDCQKLVCERHVDVAKTLHWLLEYAPSRMTGTGACIFAIFEHRKEALKVQALLPNEMTSFIANGVNLSPLHNQIQSHV
ncbi:4-(cytidine 5'-diphospho)-2-C-methyl-D-erythritol kinase [uncultured Paraglaciecola sp.]|uniref:4-(cytidine 5'-diphospho)-2-C-methyl-D-erythritol kinase n=1 Tax=uncultured Paraglaciecola sp. TaxID=1765024 RepID=UPI002598044D|nr:4-(cytidine 5'-diphospho)-2-C-methyl-D-erythritol kinase [uncultured Paraglaciecola sp.]